MANQKTSALTVKSTFATADSDYLRGVSAYSTTPVSRIFSAASIIKGVRLKRVASTTDDATSVIDCDSYDEYYLTAVANATEFSVTGTPTTGQEIFIGFKDAGVSKSLTWTGITALGVVLPTATVASKWHLVKVKYISSAWYAIAVSVQS